MSEARAGNQLVRVVSFDVLHAILPSDSGNAASLTYEDAAQAFYMFFGEG
ncbi:MAG: hypothetical protein ACI9Y1_002307 [Lentisphaeria bacterium]|jgi:hypothetical protein